MLTLLFLTNAKLYAECACTDVVILTGEIFPTDVRTTAHGVSAMVGKCGALMAGIMFHYISNVAKFWWCFGTCAAGLVLSILFVPDLTGLDLYEGDRRWKMLSQVIFGDIFSVRIYHLQLYVCNCFNIMLQGNALAYTGEAVNPARLSLFEKLTGLGRHYDAAADLKVRETAAQETVA